MLTVIHVHVCIGELPYEARRGMVSNFLLPLVEIGRGEKNTCPTDRLLLPSSIARHFANLRQIYGPHIAREGRRLLVVRW